MMTQAEYEALIDTSESGIVSIPFSDLPSEVQENATDLRDGFIPANAVREIITGASGNNKNPSSAAQYQRVLKELGEDAPVSELTMKISTLIKDAKFLLQREPSGELSFSLDWYSFINKLDPETEKIMFLQLFAEDPKPRKSSFYVPESLSIMFNSDIHSSLPLIRARGVADIDPITHSRAISLDPVQIVISNENVRLGIGESKILNAATAAFTEQNSQNEKTPNQRVYIDFMEYARACKVKVDEDQMPTPEEQKQEHRRIEDNKKNFAKKVRNNLHNLKAETTFKYTGKSENKTKSFGEISLVSGFEVRYDYIKVEFSLSASEYFVKQPLTSLPTALYGIDDRDFNTYNIGRYLSAHYSMNQNVRLGTENVLKVESILKNTTPTIEDLEKSGEAHKWESRIKDRFEESLERLRACGLLKDWCYAHTKGEPLTDEEAANITSYASWSQLLILYEINGFQSRRDRIALMSDDRKKN